MISAGAFAGRADGAVKQSDTGIVFDIQRYSLHDGPGIRTTVFLKGCPLRCLWCANPESQSPEPSLLARDIRCKSCGACAQACPQGAIRPGEPSGRAIDRGRCDWCMKCVDACLYGSLVVCGKPMGVDEVVDEALRDALFYRNSGGGVTLSGGEVLSQGRFARALLQRCKQQGLHTAVDTSGYAPWKTLEALLPSTDLVLFDVKHLDAEHHRRATGVDNALILENLTRTAARCTTRLRMPLIAGFNDSVDHVRELALLARRLGLETISFLPYHEGGRSKCEQLGRSYPLPEARAPDDAHLLALKELVEAEGLRVAIGK